MRLFFVLLLAISLLFNPLNILCLPLLSLSDEKVDFLLPIEAFSLEIEESFLWCTSFPERVGEEEGDSNLEAKGRARDGPNIWLGEQGKS